MKRISQSVGLHEWNKMTLRNNIEKSNEAKYVFNSLKFAMIIEKLFYVCLNRSDTRKRF